jgi:oxygen-independent coproporphyrinogen-3 oxidase
MARHTFSPAIAKAEAALDEAWWGVDRETPTLVQMHAAAAAADDDLLHESVEALERMRLDELIAQTFVRHARNYLDVFYYPEPRKGPAVADPRAATERLHWGPGTARDGIALYVDVPFCETACAFCTTQGKNTHGERGPVRAYLDRLFREIRSHVQRFPDGPPPVRTLYIGGGTGSYLELDELDDLLAVLRAELGVTSAIPMTMEGSPSTMDGRKVQGLVARGFDAVSYGVESFEDPLLSDCRRAHDSRLARERVAQATAAGMGHVNIDLITGLPHQTLGDFCRTLATVGDLLPGAVTFYALRLHRKTRFWQRADKDFPAILAVYLMQVLGRLYLQRLGYMRSENNRYVRDPGYRHAQNHFTRAGGFNLGIGTRAQSQIQGLSWRNNHIARDYNRALDAGHLPLTHLTEVTPAQTRLRHFLLPFKLRPGLDAAHFQAKCGVAVDDAFGPQIAKLMANGLLQRTGVGYVLTDAGFLLETEVLRWVERDVTSKAARAQTSLEAATVR